MPPADASAISNTIRDGTRQEIVAPSDAAPIAANDAGGYRARKGSLIAAEGSSPSWVGPEYALTEQRSTPDMSVHVVTQTNCELAQTSGQARDRSADPARARLESRGGTDAAREHSKAAARRAQHRITGGDQPRDWR